MREIVRFIADMAVLISGTAVLIVVAVALSEWAIDRVFKFAGLFPTFLEFCDWRRKHKRGDSDA